MTELHPIKEAFDQADLKAQKKSKADDLKIYVASLLRTKGEPMAAKMARAEAMSEKAFRKLVNDWNLEQAQQEAERQPKQPAGDGGDDRPPPPPTGSGGEDEFWKPEKVPVKPLPADCPIAPLGRNAAKTVFYYLDGSHGLVESDRRGGHSAEALDVLFGKHIDWMWKNYRKFNEKNGKQTGIKYDRLKHSLIAACDQKGVFDKTDVIREQGGWRDRDGELVMHCGDEVLFKGQWQKPGFYDGKLYPATTRMLKPAAPPASDEDRQAHRAMISKLLTHLDTWNWQNMGDAETIVGYGIDVDGSGHKLASLMYLGWHGAAKAGGALRHRPVIWISGLTGTGKSTLLENGEGLHGNGMIRSSNATAAGVWTPLGMSSRPVGIDEAEPEPGSRRVQELVRLAREAATGGKILRGSSSHEGKQFDAHCAFQFSSILVPSLLGQDQNRICILDLGSLGDRSEPKITERELEAIGAVMLRRLIDGWPRWADTFQTYRNALAKEGHDPRGCNQFGTLLAMADLMRFDECADAETVALLAGALSSQAVTAAQGRSNDSEDMLRFLTTKPLDVFRGGTRMTIGRLVEIACGLIKELPEGAPSARQCVDALEAQGIFPENAHAAARVVLPNSNEGLRLLFNGSRWESQPATTGVWAQAMRRLPKANQVNSSKVGGRGWSVPAAIFLQKPDKR